MDDNLQCIIMAGGLGKRMSSNKAKVLHHIQGKPMIYYVLNNAFSVGVSRVFLVVGKYKNDIENELSSLFSKEQFQKIVFVVQPESMVNGELCSLGTGDAIRSCLTYFEDYKLSPKTNILILSGDVPFIIQEQLLLFTKMPNSIMVSNVENPTHYGRVFYNEQQYLTDIVEHSICDEEQLLCKTVNAGIYNLTVSTLNETIPNIEMNQRKKEFFLTDFYKHTTNNIFCFFLPDVPKNINTLKELEEFN